MARVRRLILLATAAAALIAATPAQASFPGRNGPFVLSLSATCDVEDADLFTMPWRGGQLERLTDGACGSNQRSPAFSGPDAAPDGRSIVFRTTTVASGYATLSLVDGTLTEVPTPGNLAADGASPSFAPDGRRFAAEADRFRGGRDREPLWEVPLDGAQPRQIDDGCPGKRPCSVFNRPRWSPDGRLIAVQVQTYGYKRDPKGQLRSGLWLVRASSGRPVRRLAGIRASQVDWAPDGRHLVFATRYRYRLGGKPETNGGNLYVVRRNGRHRRTLVSRRNSAEIDPAWSPDGRRIAWVSVRFHSNRVEPRIRAELKSVKARGGRPRLVRELPSPEVDEGFFRLPDLTWLPKR